ncbi:MAG: hypothetical protein GTN76_04610 [Candidatus Aenigmarchaeota archaeon]|nr:hypothetical protein [Candidatus Aenigmarchaeota archaeon]
MIIYVTALIVVAGYFFYAQRGKFVEILAAAQLRVILLSLAGSVINTIVYSHIHRIIYRGLGTDISHWEMYRVIYVSRLGNYVPGRFWFAANYYIFSRKLNIDGRKIAKTYIIDNSMLFFTAIICALPVIFLLPPSVQKLFIVLPFAILILIHPKVLNRFIDTLSSKVRLQENSQDGISGPNYTTYIKVFGLYFVIWLVAGFSMYVVLLALQQVSIKVIPICLSASASSTMIGLLAVFAPAGLGVKEGIGVLVLSQVTSIETAAVVVAILRINQVITELVCGSISAISLYREEMNRKTITTACS